MKAILIVSASKSEEGRMFGKFYKDLAVLNVKGKGPGDLSTKAQRIADIFMEKAGLDRTGYGFTTNIYYRQELPGLGFATLGKDGLKGEYSTREDEILDAKKYVILNK